jgi:hypothetical protein
MFASHGYHFQGHQCIASNEYDVKRGCMKLICVEQDIRTLAEKSSNIYFLIVFACCRANYSFPD